MSETVDVTTPAQNDLPVLPSPSLIDLPRDGYAHPEMGGGELWWITGRLRSGERDFGAQTMLSTVGGAGLMVSTCVTDHVNGERATDLNMYELDKVTLATDRLEVLTPTSSLTGSFDREAWLRARVSDEASIDVTLRPTSPVLHNCVAGSFPLADLRTWQYAAPALATTGTVTLAGEAFKVNGSSWLDRQWFDRFDASAMQELVFTWMGICLENGDNLSLWDRTVADPSEKSWVTIAHPSGCHTVAAVVPVARDAADHWTSGSGNVYPGSWTVRIPELDATLKVTSTPLHEILDGMFYTGVLTVSGSYRGEPISGYGFCDLVGWAAARQ